MPVMDLSVCVTRPPYDLPPAELTLGGSCSLQVVRQKLEKVARAHVPVLIYGESGTGKEVLAKLIHCRSPWRSQRFIKLNCLIADTSIFDDNSLLGRGSTSADTPQAPSQPRGTLFLDEVAALRPELQLKLLHVLQREHASGGLVSDGNGGGLRLICATSQPLDQHVKSMRFRSDLFYCLNVITLHVPPLRERRESIPELIDYFLQRQAEQYGSSVRPPSTRLVALLNRYNWPGNIRELQNLIERYWVLESEDALLGELGHPYSVENGSQQKNATKELGSLKAVTRTAVRELEQQFILRALEENHGNRKQAARALKISYRALLYKIKDIEANNGSRAGEREPFCEDNASA